MNSLRQFASSSFKKQYVTLCFHDSKIHLLVHATDKIVCGHSRPSCYFKREVFIKHILEFMIYRIETVKKSSEIASCWDYISSDNHANGALADIFDGFANALYETLDADETHFNQVSEYRFCEQCLGIFLGSLFATRKNEMIDSLLEAYL